MWLTPWHKGRRALDISWQNCLSLWLTLYSLYITRIFWTFMSRKDLQNIERQGYTVPSIHAGCRSSWVARTSFRRGLSKMWMATGTYAWGQLRTHSWHFMTIFVNLQPEKMNNNSINRLIVIYWNHGFCWQCQESAWTTSDNSHSSSSTIWGTGTSIICWTGRWTNRSSLQEGNAKTIFSMRHGCMVLIDRRPP